MTMVIFVSAVALVVVALGYLLVRGRSHSPSSVSDLIGNTRPTDLEAFLNLVNPEEETYLRSMLSRAEFSRVQRARVAAALEYVACVRHNATVLLELGDAAQRFQQEHEVELGKEITRAALRLRMLTLAAHVKLLVCYLVPNFSPAISSVVGSYRSLTDKLGALCRLQTPSEADRILAAL